MCSEESSRELLEFVAIPGMIISRDRGNIQPYPAVLHHRGNSNRRNFSAVSYGYIRDRSLVWPEANGEIEDLFRGIGSNFDAKTAGVVRCWRAISGENSQGDQDAETNRNQHSELEIFHGQSFLIEVREWR
jgi:hypothetical protein